MKRFKVGVFGAGRGLSIANNFKLLDCDIVALCDFHKERREHAAEKLGADVAVYENFDDFIKHDMDIVILANYFHEHAPFAIKCFEKGIHVYSECISNGTMAEGVELVRAFEKSKSIYMLGENYPQMIFNREIKRICDTGTLGKIMYAEGEYNHPSDENNIGFKKAYFYILDHWRHYTPATYYITHSLGPVMWATGATPKKVVSYPIFAPVEGEVPNANTNGDRTAVIMTLNDDGSVFRVTGCSKFGGHHNAYRVCGTNGQIENLRGMGNKVMLRYNSWQIPEGYEEINLYEPKWNDPDEETILSSGHGGGDYLTARHFIDCIKAGKQPEFPFDVYSATVMSSVAILSHRSMLEGGISIEIPDFRKEEDRIKYENDRKTPYYGSDGSVPNIPCCSRPDFKPDEKQVELFKKALGIE